MTPGVDLSVRPAACPLPLDWLSRHRYAVVPAECAEALDGLQVSLIRLVPDPFQANTGDMPALLDLQEMDDAARAALYRRLDDSLMAGDVCATPLLIDCDLSAESMCVRWRKLQVVRHGQQLAWLRAFDPRVLVHLPRVLGAPAWLRITSGWRSVALCMGNRWSHVDLKPSTAVLLAEMQVDAEAWAALARIGAVNRALARLGVHTADALAGRGAALDALCAQGQQRLGLERPHDMAVYALMALDIHPDFDKHPLALAALSDGAQAPRRGVDAMERLEGLPPEQRARIRQALNESATSRI